jgi:hypothetical protein
VKIAAIKFAGNDNIKARRLRKEMETKKWWMFSWLTGSGRFKDDQFEDDLEKVRDYYREEGFLDVAIDEDKIRYDYPSPSKLGDDRPGGRGQAVPHWRCHVQEQQTLSDRAAPTRSSAKRAAWSSSVEAR